MSGELIPIMVVAPLMAAVIANLLHGKERQLRLAFVGFVFLLLFLPLASQYGIHIFGGHERSQYQSSNATGIIYLFGQHQKLLIFILVLIGYLVISSYMGVYKKLSGPYLGFLMLGIGATSAVVMADDFFNFYVFMEIALISQTALAIATGTFQAYKSAVKYLIIANVCGNFLLLGVAMLLSLSGSVNISDIAAQISDGQILMSDPLLITAACFILFAWLYAGGVFPFHNIKSELYAAARPHSSAIMQTQTKFILVALGLIILRLFSGIWGVRQVMMAGSAGAMIFGVIMALKQDDYHKMLSYHAISQGGYVACGLAIGTPYGILAGIFHAVNHVLYKSALFLGCEALERHKGTTSFSKLGGAIHSIPFIGFLVLCAKLAISGVPPFNGFQSKLMLMVAAFDAGMPEITMVMMLVSVLTFISMMKAFHFAYLRSLEPAPRNKADPAELTHYTMALVILVGLCVLLGLFPDIALGYLEHVSLTAGAPWR